MQKVQGQEPALEETRNSKVNFYFSFILQNIKTLLGSFLAYSIYGNQTINGLSKNNLIMLYK